MIDLVNFSFEFGGRYLFKDAGWQIKPGERIGLIGQNGTGKSTLLRVINGEYTLSGGSISKAKDVTIGFLNQDLLSYESDDSIFQVALGAFDRVLQLEEEMATIYEKMATDDSEALMDKLTNVQTEFDALDGYNIHHKTEKVLEGLGFTTEGLQRPLREFSGGWRMRVMLAKLLLQNPSVLLLDEPTNHLDLESITAFNNGLIEYKGTVIFTSHDHEFTHTVANRVIEIGPNGMIDKLMSYDDFLDSKEIKEQSLALYAAKAK